MAITRVSDAQSFALLNTRVGRLQVAIRELQEQIASGRRLRTPETDPLGAAEVVRGEDHLAALAQHLGASRFGSSILGAEDEALDEGGQILVRAQEIATQQSSSLLGPGEREGAREEVHALLQALTAVANSEHAGRRLFGGLALDAPPPFADPDSPGYSASTAYSGSTQDFFVKIGSSVSERVRISTRGDTVFGQALEALEALETALATNGDVAGTLSGLEQGRIALTAERASVGARQRQLIDRDGQVRALQFRQQEALSEVRDADLATVITQLTQAQTALQASLAVGAQLAELSLASLIRV
jgi:flagellar hook-associated protein 3 FlgL